MSGVEIRLLGGFAATVDGVAVGEGAWRLRKARELVKLLALAHGGRLHREQVMDTLWPDRAPASAANNLNQAVHAARRALGRDVIASHDQMLLLAAEVDAVEFEHAAAAARRAGTARAYQAALALYRGELLPENRYDDWTAARREELEELRLSLLEQVKQLGQSAHRFGLPAETSSLVGRENELASLGRLLARTRLLTLTGPGGVGKTRLALALARGVSGSFADGAALVELSDVADTDGVVDAFSTAVDVRALPGGTTMEAIGDFLASRDLLLLVDNCEHVLSTAAELVHLLLRRAPDMKAVATSREPLRVSGEVVFRVPPLAVPDPHVGARPSELLRFESVQLFVARAADASGGFVLDDSNSADVARICVRLDGLPLALELAAARANTLGTEAIADRLDDRFALLRSGSPAAVARQQTLAATLEWSYELLDVDESTLFSRLGAFAGGFDLAAVETVCAGEGLVGGEVAGLLARLVEKSLVSAERGDRSLRYRLLESVQLFARSRLEGSGEAPAVRARHAAWALKLAQRSHVRDEDAANIAAALELLTAKAPAEALRLCVALGPFWLRRMEIEDANRALGDALAASALDAPLRADALRTAAGINLRGGDPARGLAYAEQSLDAALMAGDSSATWRALQLLGEYELTYGQVPAGIGRLEQGLEAARRHGLAAEEAVGVYTLGVAHWLKRSPNADALVAQSVELLASVEGSPDVVPAPINVAEARTELRVVLEDTLQPFVEVPCAAALAYIRANQAVMTRLGGDLVGARELLQESFERFASLGDERGQAHVLSRRAYLELAAGDLDEARTSLTEALQMRRALNDRRSVGLALSGLALVETEAGNYRRARTHLAEATEIFLRAGDRWGLVNALWRQAELETAADDFDAAESSLHQALQLLAETKLERWIAHTLAALAETALRRGETKRASDLLTEAADKYMRAGDPAGLDAIRERHGSLAKPLQS